MAKKGTADRAPPSLRLAITPEMMERIDAVIANARGRVRTLPSRNDVLRYCVEDSLPRFLADPELLVLLKAEPMTKAEIRDAVAGSVGAKDESALLAKSMAEERKRIEEELAKPKKGKP